MDHAELKKYTCEKCGGIITYYFSIPTHCPICIQQRLKKEMKKEMSDKVYVTLPFAVRPDEPTVNGRVYPKELLDDMIKEFMDKKHDNFVYLGIDSIYGLPLVNISNAAAIVKSVHDYKFEILLLSTPNGEMVKELLANKLEMEIQPLFVGEVKDNQVQKGAKLERVAIVNKEIESGIS